MPAMAKQLWCCNAVSDWTKAKESLSSITKLHKQPEKLQELNR
jgi:hypothetical protein